MYITNKTQGVYSMKKINIFLGITFVITWAMCFWLMGNGGYQNPYAQVVLVLCMMVPAIASIVTSIITGEKCKDLWIKPNFKKNKKYYLIAWFLPAILIVIGSLVYYLIFPSHCDLSMSTFIELTKSQMESIGQVVPSSEELKSLLIMQVIVGVLLVPILNFVTCLGEELGWRGYLLPSLKTTNSQLKATIKSGVIWGVWHAPMIAMGHNYGLDYFSAPWGGIVAMIIFCVIVGSFLSYITLKTKSCIPAVFSHGMINGFASFSAIFIAVPKVNPFLGPTVVGVIGGIGFIVTGIICLRKINIMDNEVEEISV